MWSIELSGPIAIGPDGKPRQIGATYTEPDRPERMPHDPRYNPRFPLQLLDVERKEIIRSIADPIEGGSRLLSWSLAPGGSKAAATVLDPKGKQHVLVWDADSGNLLHRIATRSSPDSPALPPPGLAFAPDASLLAGWDGSGWVDVWSMPEGQAVTSFQARNPVYCVAFGRNHWSRSAPSTPAEQWMIASGGSDGLITLWNPATRGSWQLLQGAGDETRALAFSGDGTLLASAGRTTGGYLWDVATGRLLVVFNAFDYTTALAFSPDGTRVVGSSWYPFEKTPALQPRTRIFALDENRGVRHLRGIPGPVVKVAFSRDGKRVAALSWNWWAAIWDRDAGRLLRLCAVPRGLFADNADLAFSPDARSLVVSGGNTATLWDLSSGEARRWTLPWGLTEAIAFADAGHLMLMRSEVRDGSRPPDSAAPLASFPRVCVLRNLLGREPTEPVKIFADLNRSVQEIEASPDATHFVVDGIGGVDRPNLQRKVRIYGADGAFVTELPTQLPPEADSGKFIFDPTGRLLIHNPSPRSVLLEIPVGRFLGPSPVARPMAVAQNARLWIGNPSDNSHLQVYDRGGIVLLDQLSQTTSGINMHFSPDLDGRYLIWGDRSGAVSLVDLVEIQRQLTSLGLGW